MGDREGGAEIGVTRLRLTGEGRKILGKENVNIHEYHRREIKTKAKGFVSLAEENQMFTNEAKTIWTFQGHPEMNGQLAKDMLADTPAYMGVEQVEREEIGKRMEREHDGVAIWRRILAWVGE